MWFIAFMAGIWFAEVLRFRSTFFDFLGCLVSDFVFMDRDQVFARTDLLFAAFYANSCTQCST